MLHAVSPRAAPHGLAMDDWQGESDAGDMGPGGGEGEGYDTGHRGATKYIPCRDVGTLLKLGGSPIGGSSRSVWGSDLTNLTYPQIRVSPRISATLF